MAWGTQIAQVWAWRQRVFLNQQTVAGPMRISRRRRILGFAGVLAIGWTAMVQASTGVSDPGPAVAVPPAPALSPAPVPAPSPADAVPSEAPPPALTDAERYAPSVDPDRIVLTWSADPATTQTVTWRTSAVVERAVAEIAVAEGGPAFAEHARSVEATTRPFTSDLSTYHVHTAIFRDLDAGTLYAYRVGDGVNFSAWHQFRTAGVGDAPFSFIYFGDAQNDIRSMWSRVVRQAFADAPRAAFTLHAGDLVNRGDRDGEWGAWFAAGAWVNNGIPVVATPGNHDYVTVRGENEERLRRLSPHWGMQFTYPRNGPEPLQDSVYYLDYQNTRIVSLNSNEQPEVQALWLDAVLADDSPTWTIVTFHHPIYSTAPKRDNAELRALWKPIFDRHRVDLVLNGHDHAYGRSAPVGGEVGDEAAADPAVTPAADSDPATAAALEEVNVEAGVQWRSPAGTVYVVSVSGPKMYDVTTEPRTEFRRTATHTQLYQIITIAGAQLHYQARDATGALRDEFTLRKRPGAASEWRDKAVSPSRNEPRP